MATHRLLLCLHATRRFSFRSASRHACAPPPARCTRARSSRSSTEPERTKEAETPKEAEKTHLVVVGLDLHQRREDLLVLVRVDVAQRDAQEVSLGGGRVREALQRRVGVAAPERLQLRHLRRLELARAPQLALAGRLHEPRHDRAVLHAAATGTRVNTSPRRPSRHGGYAHCHCAAMRTTHEPQHGEGAPAACRAMARSRRTARCSAPG